MACAIAVACVLGGCAGLARDLDRAQANYADARYEEALAWLSQLDAEESRMTAADRARYHYLRGMSAHRLGRHDEARHHLAIARALVRAGAPLEPRWVALLERALAQRLSVAGGSAVEAGRDGVEDRAVAQ